ncbi:hypothetical protein A8C75_14440 [Marinobacterium aestuarii]|uniref:DUF4357 domain-containing protein n=1 Tax=Marinobacterium aestuarii TaxID=1821621 RepID=A0A1A9F1E6_9GAMM|nr:GIY-YIG nuclease family protein [Marinobacterium aestuarii]ANG63553.1 hypothetical protein A8C75_14440 [Marinobacterium aestuarii]
MPSATIKLFLIYGDSKRLRTAELSNWSGKAVGAPRTELDELLAREELLQSGVYILTGYNPASGAPLAYIGEAEVLKDRLKAHKSKEFWVQATVFISKDENLTKSHIRYLEGRLIEEAKSAARYDLDNGQASGSRLPESDREDMEIFLSKIQQLLPVLGSELLTPVVNRTAEPSENHEQLVCAIKGIEAHGEQTSSGFVIFKGSRAVLADRPSAAIQHPFVVTLRQKLVAEGVLVEDGSSYLFTKDTEFTSPSSAAAVVHGGGANGLIAWKNAQGQTLKGLGA